MRRAPIALVLAALALTPGAGSTVRADDSPPVERMVLPGGAVVILPVHPTRATFAIRARARGGDAEDDAARDGLTPLLARMLLRGTRQRTASDQALAVESTGSTLVPVSGFMGFGLAAEGPAGAAIPVLEVTIEALLHPALEQAEADREKTLMRSSLRGDLDHPSTLLSREARATLLGDHPLGRTPSPEGWLETVDGVDLREAHARRVRPARLVFVLAGAFPRDAAIDAIRHGLSRGPEGGDLPPLIPAPVPLPDPVQRRVRARTPQPEVLVAYPTRGASAADQPALDLLMHLLTGYQERIAGRLRDREGWAYWVEGMDLRYPDAGIFGVRTAVPKRRLQAAAAILTEEIARLANIAPSQEETDRARRYLTTQRARAWQRPAWRAATLAAAEIRGEPLLGIEDQEARMAAVTPAAIRDLARRVVSWSAPAVITLR